MLKYQQRQLLSQSVVGGVHFVVNLLYHTSQDEHFQIHIAIYCGFRKETPPY